jgi:hypothetical protein
MGQRRVLTIFLATVLFSSIGIARQTFANSQYAYIIKRCAWKVAGPGSHLPLSTHPAFGQAGMPVPLNLMCRGCEHQAAEPRNEEKKSCRKR